MTVKLVKDEISYHPRLFCFSLWVLLPWPPPSSLTMASMTMEASLTTLTMEELVSINFSLLNRRAARIVAALQLGCEEMKRE